MTILPESQGNDNAVQKRFEIFIKRFKINHLLRSVRATKDKGVPAYSIFAFLMELVFKGKNLYMTLAIGQSKPSFGKDTVYRFLHKAYVQWERFLFKLSTAVITEVNRLTSDERKCAFIIDDTPYYRNRSKKVEMLSRCFDHSEHKYYKGFSMLTLGWSDGQTFMPVDFRLLASGKDEHILCPSQVKTDKRTLATRRRIDARKEKPTLMLEMLKNAKGAVAKTKYVLFDSWFASPSSILSVKRFAYDVVARLKNHKNYRYLYEGECLSIEQIYRKNRKRRGLSRFLLSVEIAVRHIDYNETVPAKLVYVRDKGNRKKWITFVSTDISLSEDEIIALYGKRWDIEPYHKVLKSCLHLTKEFQLRSFDAITAHTVIVLTRYIFLSLENRENKDERTMGELFHVICDELDDISFNHAFGLIMSTIEDCLLEYLHLAKSAVNALVEQFLLHLPDCIKGRLMVSTWSSRNRCCHRNPSRNRAGAINAHGSSQVDSGTVSYIYLRKCGDGIKVET